MFGHSDNNQQIQTTGAPANSTSQTANSGHGLNDMQARVEPSLPVITAPTSNINDSASVSTTQSVTPTPQSSTLNPPNNGVTTAPVTNNDVDLADIKQKALKALSPLVSNLKQDPLDKFKTTMMMIQASDNKNLIPDAYNAAQAITDEKAKAQALLDIVNEINYFTQQTSN